MTNLLNILVVDDEPQSRSLIKKLLTDAGHGNSIAEAGSVKEAISHINANKPSLLFLDVQMKGETGFDLLDQLPDINFEIIFTTAHSEFAVKAFRYSALDYLVKPLDPEEFQASFQRAMLRVQQQQSYSSKQVQFLQQQVRSGDQIPDKLIIPTLEGYLFIPIADIIYCRAVNNYTEFILPLNKKIISSHTLGYYEECLQPNQFFRVHRSFLVSLSHIKMYKRGDGGTVTMSNDHEIEVSRNNKEGFLKLFKA